MGIGGSENVKGRGKCQEFELDIGWWEREGRIKLRSNFGGARGEGRWKEGTFGPIGVGG